MFITDDENYASYQDAQNDLDVSLERLRAAQDAGIQAIRRQVREDAERRAAIDVLRGKRPFAIPEMFRNPAAGSQRND